jgi:hypothetical protein
MLDNASSNAIAFTFKVRVFYYFCHLILLFFLSLKTGRYLTLDARRAASVRLSDCDERVLLFQPPWHL